MKGKRFKLSEDSLDAIFASKGVVFDTNVWLRVDGIHVDTTDQRSKAYTWLYKKILEKSHPIYLPQVVLSEYVNVTLAALADDDGWERRRDGKIHQQANYKNWIEDVAYYLGHVSKGARPIDDNFCQVNAAQCIEMCQKQSIDFNDVLIAEICRRNDLILVSDDGDLSEQDITIVSANKRLH